MTPSYARLLRASLVALVVAAGFATIKLVAEDVCGNPLQCFEPGQEGEIWQALAPFGQTNDQVACENSLHPDPARYRPLPRQCYYDDQNGVPFGVLMPPKLGWMMDPFMLAVDGERIYVSDQSNHRIQAFKFDGTPIPMAHPIGDGIPGAGAYGPYPADPRMTGHTNPITGVRLSSPDGIAVDADHKLIVGDASGTVNVFNADGSPAFGTIASPQRLAIPRPFGMETTATGIAITPGTIVRGFGVPIEPGDTGRIVITDRFKSFVFIYDAGFNLIKQIPEDIPDNAEADSVCVWSETAPLGTFCTPVMAAIDGNGHIFISEYDNNRIQVLDDDGTPISYFGSSDLQYPWGITLDHRGRLVVADTENQRIAFFNITYPNGVANPPLSTFLFELDAKGTLNGYPSAVIEQAGTGNGLDPAGRILVTDTLNNRVQRFQLPDLAIINPQLDLANGYGTFQVAVPAAKAAGVSFVGVSATGVDATVLSINGMTPANTTPLNPLNTALQNATAALGTNILPGQIATYEFTFGAGTGSNVSFVFDAVGNNGATSADPTVASAAAPCTLCVSTHTLYEKPASGPPITVASTSNGWFNKQLVARIDATSNDASGLSAIAFQFLTGPEASGPRWGGSVHTVPVSGAAAFYDINILTDGVSSFRYWAIGGDGTVEASHFVTVSLDLIPPSISYTLNPAPNAAGWNNSVVNGTFTHADGRSGAVFTGVGTFSFADEGRGYYHEETATDKAGNTSDPVRSDYSGAGGRTVNIDLHAPVFDFVPNDVTVVASGPDYGVVPAGTFDATAHDPDLLDPRPDAVDKSGSGLVSLTNPGANQFPMGASSWPFTATDAAGNVATTTRTVTVIKASSSVAANSTAIVYGEAVTIPATISPAWATGSLTFTLDGGAPVSVGLSGGGASIVLPSLSGGDHSLVIAYPGSASVEPSSTTITITVAKLQATLTIADANRLFGAPNPAFSATVTGLIGTDTLSYTLTTPAVALSNVGNYPITAALGANNNYTVAVTNGTLRIDPATANVAAQPKLKTYGDANPPLTATVTGQVAGAPITYSLSTAAAQSSGIGSYPITVALGANPNYLVSTTDSTLTIGTRPATLRANDAQKLVGAADPPLTTTPTNFLGTDGVIFSATRAPGEIAGTYAITPSASGAAAGNYAITLINGTFTIVDNRPPVCTAAYGGEIWPPNHKKFYAAPINGVTDPDGGAITIKVTGIWQDEKIDSTGDGQFSPDGQGVGTSTAWVRAERNGLGNKAAGNGRVYEILFIATDNKGATCSGSVLWTVPHDQGQRATAIDDGVRYDSTGVIAGPRDKSQINRKSPTP